jgi:hypothetical protein
MPTRKRLTKRIISNERSSNLIGPDPEKYRRYRRGWFRRRRADPAFRAKEYEMKKAYEAKNRKALNFVLVP